GLSAGRDPELREDALHMRAHGVLGDEQALRDLVGVEPLVEQEQHLDLPGAQSACDRVRNAAARVAPAALAHLLEQAARDRTRERRFAAADAADEFDDPLRRLALEQVAGGPAANRGEEVVLGAV